MPERDSIFKDLDIRDPQKAFENAISRGMKNPEDWMYMYTDGKWDCFKHHVTRSYTRFENTKR